MKYDWKKKTEFIDFRELGIKPIEFGEIAIKYQHGKPVLIIERKQVKINDELYTTERKIPIVN